MKALTDYLPRETPTVDYVILGLFDVIRLVLGLDSAPIGLSYCGTLPSLPCAHMASHTLDFAPVALASLDWPWSLYHGAPVVLLVS